MSSPSSPTNSFDIDVCVIGTGRVGLPLALSFIDAGLSVAGVDTDPTLRDTVNNGRMPFKEPGYDELVASRGLSVHATPEIVSSSSHVIVTVGTPLHTHIETDLRQVRSVLESVAPFLRPGQLICLRSTVAPGTTDFVARWLAKHTNFRVGTDIDLVFCPERIAEGKAREELRSLPQIIGAASTQAGERAEKLFARLTTEFFHTDYVSAELVKLFNNINRYVHFALANQFAIIADTFGSNIYEILEMANYNYPRNRIASPGFTAGTCLRKDFGMINEWTPYPDMLLSAWKMNEYIPAFLVQHMKQRTALHQKTIGILGYSFKADTDDIRDSLAPKLNRYIEREIPERILISDENLPTPTFESDSGVVENVEAAELLEAVDVVFIATNHSSYPSVLERLARCRPQAWVADLWNSGRTGKIFYRATEVLEIGGLK